MTGLQNRTEKYHSGVLALFPGWAWEREQFDQSEGQFGPYCYCLCWVSSSGRTTNWARKVHSLTNNHRDNSVAMVTALDGYHLVEGQLTGHAKYIA